MVPLTPSLVFEVGTGLLAYFGPRAAVALPLSVLVVCGLWRLAMIVLGTFTGVVY